MPQRRGITRQKSQRCLKLCSYLQEPTALFFGAERSSTYQFFLSILARSRTHLRGKNFFNQTDARVVSHRHSAMFTLLSIQRLSSSTCRLRLSHTESLVIDGSSSNQLLIDAPPLFHTDTEQIGKTSRPNMTCFKERGTNCS